MIECGARIYRNHTKAEVIPNVRVIRPLPYTELEHRGRFLVSALLEQS
jgi:hypothetical protein